MPWRPNWTGSARKSRRSCLRQWSWAALTAVLSVQEQLQRSGGADAVEVAVAVRGVSPADQAKYVPVGSADGAQTFHCFSGATSDAAAQLPLPFTAVNDNFCDCTDGSDEPGTGACAGQKETLFYCNNEHSIASFIYTSHVNDGICDCCDGSDEWSQHRPSHCRNTCDEEGLKLRRELADKEAVWKKGAAKRVKLTEAAKVKLEQAKKDLLKVQSELPNLEAVENTTAAALKVAQRALDEERARANHKQPEANATANNTAAASATAEDIAAYKQRFDERWAQFKEMASESASGQAAVPPAEASTQSASPLAGKEEGQSAEGDPVVSEYTKWMDGAEKALGSSGTVSKAAPVEEEVDDLDDDRGEEVLDVDEGLESEEEVQVGFFTQMRRSFVRFVRSIYEPLLGKGRTPTEIARDDADKAHKDAKKKLQDAKTQLTALDKKVNANLTEEQLAFSALDGQCISKKLAEYKYEVCFWSTAKQDSTSIGTFARWEGSDVVSFNNGQYCPGGPSRSLRVRFHCGDKEEILDITEPSRCTYEARMSHPAVCTGVLPSEAQQGRIRMPSDEL